MPEEKLHPNPAEELRRALAGQQFKTGCAGYTAMVVRSRLRFERPPHENPPSTRQASRVCRAYGMAGATNSSPPKLIRNANGEGTAMPEDTFHPIADLFPLLDREDFNALVEDVRAHGVRTPITVHRDGRVLDGRNRWRACQVVGVDCPTRRFEGTDDEILPFILSANLHRRHLDASQRAMVAARLARLRDGQRKSASPIGEAATTQGEAAGLLNVGERSVERARIVLDSGSRYLVSAVDEAEVSVSEAAEIAQIVLPEVREEARKNAIQKEKAEKAEFKERCRSIVEEWRAKLRAEKIEEARSEEVDGVIPLPDTPLFTASREGTEKRASDPRLYGKLHDFLRQDPMSPEQAARLVPARFRDEHVEQAKQRQAWLAEFLRLLEPDDAKAG